MKSSAPRTCPSPTLSQSEENSEYAYKFFITDINGIGNQADQPWTSGTAPDGHGKFEPFVSRPLEGAGEPNLGFGRPDTYGQKEQAATNVDGIVAKGKDIISRMTNH